MAETKGAESPKSAPKKGTAASEVIIGAAAAEIKKSITALGAAMGKVEDLANKAEEAQAIIAQREDKIKELDTEFSEKRRQKTVELEVELKANERKVVDGILDRQGLVAVDKADYSKLEADADKVNRDIKSEVSSAVAAATGAMKKEHDNATALLNSQNETKEAKAKAELETLQSKNEFLVQQVDMWKNALDAERAAGVQRAQAASIGAVNINGAGK